MRIYQHPPGVFYANVPMATLMLMLEMRRIVNTVMFSVKNALVQPEMTAQRVVLGTISNHQ